MQEQVEKLPGSNALASFCEKDESAKEFTTELKNILEVTAATGRYWHDWRQLRVLLCFRLSQVLREFHKLQFPEDLTPIIGPPVPVSESFPDMMDRLVQNLDSFTDGAPFTSQRLCEILLCPKETYNNLDKLALALEKLLLVQSTFPASTDPYPLQNVPYGVPTEMPVEDHKPAKLDGKSMEGVTDSIESLKAIPAIDEEMLDVERVLDAQVAVEMVAHNNSEMLHEPSVTELQQTPGNSEMLHDSTGVEPSEPPGTSSEMNHDSAVVEILQAPSAASEMLLETLVAESAHARPSSSEMLHDSTVADLAQVPAPNFEVPPYSAGNELPETIGTNSDMLHDSGTGQEPPATGTNSEMIHNSTAVKSSQPGDSNTAMVDDSTGVDRNRTDSLSVSHSQGVGSSTDTLHDSTVVDLPAVIEESINSSDVKPSEVEGPVKSQSDSTGVNSPQASEGSSDMKQTGPDESVNSHVPNPEDEDRLDDVSMGMVG